jgi:hypothetical protein
LLWIRCPIIPHRRPPRLSMTDDGSVSLSVEIHLGVEAC